MGTSGAENGRTGRYGRAKLHVIRFLAEQSFTQELFAVLVAEGKESLAYDVHAESLAVIFDTGVKLFDDVNGVVRGGKITDELFGQGIYKTEL